MDQCQNSSHVLAETQILDDESGADYTPFSKEFPEEGLALLKESNVSLREELHGHMAIELARHLGIFGNEQHDWPVDHHSIPSNATQDDLGRISMWHNLLQSAVNERADVSNPVPPGSADTATIERSILAGDPSPNAPAAILPIVAAQKI